MPSALVTKLRKQPEVRDAEALAAWIGRYQKLRKAGVGNKKAMKLAGKKGGMKEGGVKKKDRKTGGSGKKDAVNETPDPGENIKETGGISEQQAGFLKSLLKPSPTMPRDLEGSYKLRDRKEEMLNHALKLNAPTPKDKSQASKLISDLKGNDLPRLTHLEDGDLDDYPEDFPDWSVEVGKKLRSKYGKDLSGLQDAIQKKLKSLPEERRKFVSGEQPGSGEAFRKLVLNPLLKV